MKKHALVIYFLLAYAITWAIQFPLAASAQGWLNVHPPAALHFLGAFGPFLAAWIVTALTEGKAGLRDLVERTFRWRIGLKWFIVAAFSPTLLFLLAVLIFRLLSGEWISFSQFGYISELPNLSWPVAWLIWIVTFGLGEEMGWRGFALPRLQKNRSARAATVILGLLWAAWHIMSFFYNYGDINLFSAVIFTISILYGALILTWIYNSTGGSILAVILWHGAFNAAVAGAQDQIAWMVVGFIIITGMIVGRTTGPDLSLSGKHTL